MCFHPDRCDILSVTKSKRKHYHALHGQMLKSVNSTHFLGVTLTSDAKAGQCLILTMSNLVFSDSIIRSIIIIEWKEL